MRIITRKKREGIRFPIRIWGKSTSSFPEAAISTKATIPWDVTVAMAAPAASSLGKGPTPKISTGSRIIFAPIPMQLAKNGILQFPAAV